VKPYLLHYFILFSRFNFNNLLDNNLDIEQNLKKNTKGLCGMNKRVYLQPLLNEKVWHQLKRCEQA
jgi:hypothetical protein